MPRTGRGRAIRSTRSPATFTLDGHLIETYNHIDDLPHLSSLPKKRPRHATRGATAAERRADRQATVAADPQHPNGIVTRSSRQNLLRPSNSTSPLTAPSPSSELNDNEQPPLSCRVCLKTNTSSKIICCSICRKGIHTFCLNPPLMDLPNDASWKCIKCRRAHIPLKKEARIILRDALNTYSSLCTDKYINAVANVVCVVSDSESADPKKNPKTYVKPNGHFEPSHGRPTDNTVVLRVSTDDSDLDSDVEDDIRPNLVVNPGKLPPRRPTEHRDSNRDPARVTNPSPKNCDLVAKAITKDEPPPSSPSSLDIDDERPLSELMTRGAHRRPRQSRGLRTRDMDATHTSPKLRLKAKQRRMREANQNEPPLPASDPNLQRDPRNLPPKRRARKPATKGTDKGIHDNTNQMDADGEKDGTGQHRGSTPPVGNRDQSTEDEVPAPTGGSSQGEVKRESAEQEATGSCAPVSSAENERQEDAQPDLSERSGSNVDEGYPGDTEDDLPLSKRSARYRRLSVPDGVNRRKDKGSSQQEGEGDPQDNPTDDVMHVSSEARRTQVPKSEAILQEPEGIVNDREGESSAQMDHGDEHANSSPLKQLLGSSPLPERKPSDKWAQIRLDPKREALFALARGQRQRPKPGDSSSRLTSSFDGESSGRTSRLMSRTENVPESERQRIQVTALAASNMRRNVSNMASTMAVLRPHSPRMSKGSIDLLLQQNQSDIRDGSGAQKSHAELPIQRDSRLCGLDNPQERDVALPSSAQAHLPSEAEASKFSADMFPRAINQQRHDDPGALGGRHYGNPATAGGTETYSVIQQQNVSRTGVLSSMEPEAQPYAKHNRDVEILPHAKRHRSNKSDLSNMLSNDNDISAGEGRIVRPQNSAPKVLQRGEHPILHQSAGTSSAFQQNPSTGLAEEGQAMASYVFTRQISENRFGASGAPTHPPFPDPTRREPASIPQRSVGTIDDGSVPDNRLSNRLPYPRFPYGGSALQTGIGAQRPLGSDDRHMDQHQHSDTSSRRGYGSDFRPTSQVYSATDPTGQSLAPRLQWTEDRALSTGASRPGYTGAAPMSQHWSQTDHRSTLPESSYKDGANRFIPPDRRARRPMPYVPTATRKAQFEQGRALAIIDSRPVPPSTDPSDPFCRDDGLSHIAPSSYSPRQEGPRSRSNEYPYHSGDRSSSTYSVVNNNANANPFRSDYFTPRRQFFDSPSEIRLKERDPLLLESRRGNEQHDRVGVEPRASDRNVYGHSRPGLHAGTQNASGAPLEPPIDPQKVISLERTEAPSIGSLVDGGVGQGLDSNITRITNTFEADHRITERHRHFTARTGPGQAERAYAANNTGYGTRRGTDFVNPRYGSYPSSRNHSEVTRTPGRGVIDANMPGPLHLDPMQYQARSALGDQSRSSLAGHLVAAPGSRALYNRTTNRMSSSYGYTRGETEVENPMIPQRITNLERSKEDFGTDRISNIPLVARFDNSGTAYGDGSGGVRSTEGSGRAEERSGSQRTEQREQLPSLRSNPALRDLLS